MVEDDACITARARYEPQRWLHGLANIRTAEDVERRGEGVVDEDGLIVVALAGRSTDR